MKRKPTTTGLEYAVHSLTSFNSFGYADMSSPDNYIDSYVLYKKWRGLTDQALFVDANRELLIDGVADILSKTSGAGQKPNSENLKKFKDFCKSSKML